MKGIKEGDQWKLIEPLQVQGDKSTFDSICTTIAGSKRQNVIEKNPSDLGIFGIRNSLLKSHCRWDQWRNSQYHDFLAKKVRSLATITL